MNWTLMIYMFFATLSLAEVKPGRLSRALVRIRSGQGVVEYAGALVIATVLIVTALLTLQPATYTFFNDLQTQILTFLNSQITSLGG